MSQQRIEFGEVHLGETAKLHLLDCIFSNQITMGPKVKLLEEKWRNLFNYPYATAVNSGTSAVMACCMALWTDKYKRQRKDVQYKSRMNIVCPSLSFIASANAIRAAGFIPQFVDVDLETLNINPALAFDTVDENTIAILGVNLMGKPAKLDQLYNIGHYYNIPLIIDNCESYGSKYKGKYTLDYADMETSSHYVAHLILGCELGIVSTKDPELDQIIKSIRSHGREPDSIYFQHDIFGLNLKPSDLHASIALEGVENFWDTFSIRHENLTDMWKELKGAGIEEVAYLSDEDEEDMNCPHGLSITVKDPSTFIILKQLLDENNIHWKRNFGSMPTQHKCFEYLGYKLGDFPNAEYIGDNGLHIGVHQYLSLKEIDRIINTIKKWIRVC